MPAQTYPEQFVLPTLEAEALDHKADRLAIIAAAAQAAIATRCEHRQAHPVDRVTPNGIVKPKPVSDPACHFTITVVPDALAVLFSTAPTSTCSAEAEPHTSAQSLISAMILDRTIRPLG